MAKSFARDPAVNNLLGYEDKDDQESWDSTESLVPPRRRYNSLRKYFGYINIVLPWSLLFITLLWISSQYRKRGPNNPIFPQLTYTPAKDVLQYEKRKFELGFNDETTIYQGYPSPEIDQRWNDLYMTCGPYQHAGYFSLPSYEELILNNNNELN